MESILDQLSKQAAWEEFLTFRLQKGRFNWHDFDEADTFVSEQRYLPVVESWLRGESSSVPTKHLVNKMGSGKKRVVYSFTDDEMKVLKCLSFLLYRYDSELSPNCYSFRRGLSAHDAVLNVIHAIDQRPMWGYKLDIHNYFNSISIPILLPILQSVLVNDQPLYHFFEKLLNDDRAICNGLLIHEPRGVMAGTPISPFLANIYLMELDRYFYDRGVIYARYSDDIILFAPERETLDQHIQTLNQFLVKYNLEVNPDKVRIYELNEPFDFLGFKCQGYNIDLSEATKRKMKDKIRRKTHSLLRWRSKENIAPETVMKTLIKHFNRKFYESDEPTMLTWSRWFFPLITSTTGLKDIDHYLQDNIRYLATGKHNKSRFRIRYEYLQQLGYRSLVHEYYAAKFS
jgi:retron-type reverse transcriptase